MDLRIAVWGYEDVISNMIDITFPFEKIITHPKSTDIITSIAVSSLYAFVDSGLYQTEDGITTIIMCLCSCKYQITSEIESLNLTVMILRIFGILLANYTRLINCETMKEIFQYVEQDIRQNTQVGVHSALLSEVLSKASFIIIDDPKFKAISKDILLSLFSIADYTHINHGWIARGSAIGALVSAARSMSIRQYPIIMNISCALLFQQFELSEGKDNYVLTLRLFFHVFYGRWFELYSPFIRCLHLILDNCVSPNVSVSIKSISFDFLVDLISQKDFPILFFANNYNRPILGNLFDRFLSILIQYSNTPPVPDVQVISIAILSLLIQRLYNDISDLKTVCGELSEIDPRIEEQELYQKLTAFSNQFNEKPSSLITEGADPIDIAHKIFVAPNLSKQAIGEFFSKNNSVCNETLLEFLKLFDFSNMGFDESIRVFLTSFQIIGEGQIVDRIFENFSNSFMEKHQNEYFQDNAAVHVLSYAWLMLHTSFYNANVTKKTTLTEFFTMLKNQNHGGDFDSQFLTSIYNSIKCSAVAVEETKNFNSLPYWSLVLFKQTELGIEMKSAENLDRPSYSAKMFREIWQQAAPVFSLAYQHTIGSPEMVLFTFKCSAAISSHYSLHDILDNLVVSLCRFVNADSKHSLSEERTKDTLKALSSIVLDFGAHIHEGWKSYAEIIIGLYRFDLLPDEMRTQQNLITKGTPVVIKSSMWSRNSKTTPTTLLSVFKILGAIDADSESEGSAADQKRSEFRQFVKECKFDNVIEKSLHFTQQSLNYFIQSIILLARDSSINFAERLADMAFLIHIASQVAIVNCERISILWSVIHQLFFASLNDAKNTRPMIVFLQRSLTSMFTLVNHMWGQISMRQELIRLLDLLLTLDIKLVGSLINELLSGFKLFLNIHGLTYIPMFQFKSLLLVLRSGVSISDPSSSEMLHFLLSKYLECSPMPDIDRFSDLWIPLIQTASIYCIRDSSHGVFTRFGDLQNLLSFGGNKPTPQMWEVLFDSTLFPILENMPSIIQNQEKSPNITERTILMTKFIFKAFLTSHKALSTLVSFEVLWYKLLQKSVSLMSIADTDLKESIPQLLSNALMVMKSSGVFEDESKKKMWTESRAIIEPIAPYSSALFNTV